MARQGLNEKAAKYARRAAPLLAGPHSPHHVTAIAVLRAAILQAPHRARGRLLLHLQNERVPAEIRATFADAIRD